MAATLRPATRVAPSGETKRLTPASAPAAKASRPSARKGPSEFSETKREAPPAGGRPAKGGTPAAAAVEAPPVATTAAATDVAHAWTPAAAAKWPGWSPLEVIVKANGEGAVMLSMGGGYNAANATGRGFDIGFVQALRAHLVADPRVETASFRQARPHAPFYNIEVTGLDAGVPHPSSKAQLSSASPEAAGPARTDRPGFNSRDDCLDSDNDSDDDGDDGWGEADDDAALPERASDYKSARRRYNRALEKVGREVFLKAAGAFATVLAFLDLQIEKLQRELAPNSVVDVALPPEMVARLRVSDAAARVLDSPPGTVALTP